MIDFDLTLVNTLFALAQILTITITRHGTISRGSIKSDVQFNTFTLGQTFACYF